MDIKGRVKGAYYGWFFGPGAILRKPTGTNYKLIQTHPVWSKVRCFEEIPSDHKMYDQLTQTQIVHDILIRHGQVTPEFFRDRLLELNQRDDILNNDQYGPSTQKAVKELLSGADPHVTGKMGVTTGGAMRCLPVGIYFRDNLEALIDNTYQSCIISHNTDVAVGAALAVNLMIYFILKDYDKESALTQTLDLLEKSHGKYGESTGFAFIHQRIRDAISWIQGQPFEKAVQIIGERIGFSWYAIEGVTAGLAIYFATQNEKEAALMSFKIGSNHTAPQIACALHGAEKGCQIFPKDIIRTIEKVNSIDIDQMVDEIILPLASQNE